MLKTYRIIPLVFILFLFGFTFSTVSPVFAQTVDQLIESIEKLDANDRARVLEYKYSPPNRPSDVTPAAEADGPWDPSMGMRHPDRPCMKVNSCGRDNRSSAEIASDPYDTNNPASHARRVADTMREKVTNAVSAVKSLPGPLLKCNKPPDVDRFGFPLKHQSQGGAPQEDCNTCSTMITKWSSYIKEHGRETCIESQRINVGDTPWGDKMDTECLKQGPRDHTVPSVQVMQVTHDRCMMHARDGCGGDRSTIKSIMDNGPSQCPGYPGPCTTYRPHNKQMGHVAGHCPLEEFHLHCWKGGCTNGEGLIGTFHPCANANASDVIANRNGCFTHKLSDGTRRSVGHKDCAVSKC